VVADLPGHHDHHAVANGRPDQRIGVDGLDVAGAGRRQADRHQRRLGAAFLRLSVAGLVGIDLVDHRAGLALDLAHDGVDLDRPGQVVDEVDEDADAGQGEGQRPRHGQPGDERLLP
jgi:hypothetical protein